MSGGRSWGWLPIAAAIVLVVAVLMGVGLALAWSHLPAANISIDGEPVSLPALAGWQAVLAFLLGVVAVVLAAVLVVGVLAISIVAALLCVVLVLVWVAVGLLLVFSPVLLLGWLLWRLSRRPPAPVAALG